METQRKGGEGRSAEDGEGQNWQGSQRQLQPNFCRGKATSAAPCNTSISVTA